MLKIFVLSLVIFFSIGRANAEDTAKVLIESFFKDFKTLTADFVQTVQNSQLNATEKTEGKLWIQRPGKFRWNYEKPYQQEIVSDGEKIWIYDADLEQVTIKQVDETLGSTPAVLLSDEKPLAESFTILELENDLAVKWVELRPKNTEAGFIGIRLGFKQTELRHMVLEDNLGQTTRLNFSNLIRNQTIEETLFDFVPPKNSDIFDSTK